MAELEQNYYEITELYDLAEELVNTVEAADNPGDQLELVEPLINEVEEAADILSEEYMELAERQGKSPNKTRIEGALRKLYTAIDAYNKKVNLKAGAAVEGFRNMADPIVKKITRQLESVVAAFIDFVELSLNRIMSQSHAEELKRRQEKIAMMLHQIGQGA
jgi:sugar-specific transcriptional regulator TrmB